MKHKFRSLTCVWTIACLLAMGMVQGPNARSQEPGARGAELVADAARRVAAEPRIAAELRYRIDAFGHALVGTGTYLQLGIEPEKLVRLDLRMQVGDKTASVQEIRGVDSYWVRRDVPPLAPSLGRVDLRQLRRALAQGNPTAPEHVLPQGDWIMLGGLARLLSALDQNFAFAEPQADELQFNAAGDQGVVRLPIWRVAGHWKPEKLAALTGNDRSKPAKLPEQFPERVELILGRTSDVLPLFPFCLTYWRAESAGKAAPTERELLKLEFFNVSRRAIEPREFDYQPGDQDVQNLTQTYVQRFTSETKLR